MWVIAARATKWSLIFCSWGPTNLSTLPPLLSIRSSLLLPNTQHRGCAWVKHYNSSRKWPFLRNFQGAVKGRRLMPGQTLQGTGTPPPLPHFSLPYPFLLPTHPQPPPLHHLHAANNGMSHANERFSNRITLSAMQTFVQFSLSLLSILFSCQVLLEHCSLSLPRYSYISLRLTRCSSWRFNWLSF